MKLKFKAAGLLFLAVLLLVGWDYHPKTSATVPGVNERESVDSSGNQSNGTSTYSTINGDGSVVAFSSDATNLVSGDTNGVDDIFVRNRSTNTTSMASVSSSGVQANAASESPQISYDGRYVVFYSKANNLVSGITGSVTHIYIHDMQTGATSLVDSSSSAVVGNQDAFTAAVNADGRFVVFTSAATNLVSGIAPSGKGYMMYLKDMNSGAIKFLSKNSSGTMATYGVDGIPKISCDGNTITFASTATNLVSGDTNGLEDVFVDQLGWNNDLITDVTLSANGTSSLPDISCDGNHISYLSGANNIVSGASSGVFEYNRLNQQNVLISQTTSGTPDPSPTKISGISGDGRYVVFESNTASLDTSRSTAGGTWWVYVRDTKGGTTQNVPINQNGVFGGGNDLVDISGDGAVVSYTSTLQGVIGDPNRGLIAADNNSKPDVYVSLTGF